MPRVLPLLAVCALAVSLGGAATAAATKRPARNTVTVMTRNLYLGASLDPIIHAKSAQDAFGAVAEAWRQVQANDFPTRAGAIAAEIARAKPDFVGVQELALYRTQTPADFLQSPATQVALDYRAELMRALRARNLAYRFAAIDVNTDAEMPAGSPPQMDIRLTMRNAILVKRGIHIRNVRSANFAADYPIFPGLVVAKRGWVSLDATVGGRTFRVIDTHLEAFNGATQEAQSRELLRGPAATKLPVVLLGDLNSRPDGSTTRSYSNLIAGGFQDAWTQAHARAPGFTDGHPADLRQVGEPFSQRIDYVLVRGGFRGVRGAVTGEDESTRVDGLWPSDHGGLWLTLRLPKR